jgi:hypothetical protein
MIIIIIIMDGWKIAGCFPLFVPRTIRNNNTLYGQNAGLLIVKEGDTHRSHFVLNR